MSRVSINPNKQNVSIDPNVEYGEQNQPAKQDVNQKEARHNKPKYSEDKDEEQLPVRKNLYIDRAYAFNNNRNHPSVLVQAKYSNENGRKTNKYVSNYQMPNVKGNIHYQYITPRAFNAILMSSGQKPLTETDLERSIDEGDRQISLVGNRGTLRHEPDFTAEVFEDSSNHSDWLSQDTVKPAKKDKVMNYDMDNNRKLSSLTNDDSHDYQASDTGIEL